MVEEINALFQTHAYIIHKGGSNVKSLNKKNTKTYFFVIKNQVCLTIRQRIFLFCVFPPLEIFGKVVIFFSFRKEISV